METWSIFQSFYDMISIYFSCCDLWCFKTINYLKWAMLTENHLPIWYKCKLHWLISFNSDWPTVNLDFTFLSCLSASEFCGKIKIYSSTLKMCLSSERLEFKTHMIWRCAKLLGFFISIWVWKWAEFGAHAVWSDLKLLEHFY